MTHKHSFIKNLENKKVKFLFNPQKSNYLPNNLN